MVCKKGWLGWFKWGINELIDRGIGQKNRRDSENIGYI